MESVDSSVKDISQGQGVSLEKEGRIISELDSPPPPRSLHQGLLVESSPPLKHFTHSAVLPPVFISSFAPLSAQVNSFLCTLIGSSGSNLLCLFSNFLLIFLSSLLIPNLWPYYSYLISLCSCYSFPPGTSHQCLYIRHSPHRSRVQQIIPRPLQPRPE